MKLTPWFSGDQKPVLKGKELPCYKQNVARGDEMTEKQPEALRLADLYEAEQWPGNMSLAKWGESAAAELRRQHEVIQTLTEALSSTTASLVAAHSLLVRGGKKAAPSDKMFSFMLSDYEKSIEEGRAAFKKAKEQS